MILVLCRQCKVNFTPENLIRCTPCVVAEIMQWREAAAEAAAAAAVQAGERGAKALAQYRKEKEV